MTRVGSRRWRAFDRRGRVELEHNAATLRALLPLVEADLERFTGALRAAMQDTESDS